jgi:hypothetical protein
LTAAVSCHWWGICLQGPKKKLLTKPAAAAAAAVKQVTVAAAAAAAKQAKAAAAAAVVRRRSRRMTVPQGHCSLGWLQAAIRLQLATAMLLLRLLLPAVASHSGVAHLSRS